MKFLSKDNKTFVDLNKVQYIQYESNYEYLIKAAGFFSEAIIEIMPAIRLDFENKTQLFLTKEIATELWEFIKLNNIKKPEGQIF